MPQKILVVDDDSTILGLLHDLLTEEGYDVHSSNDTTVLQDTPLFQPDVILLDVMMPVMNGIVVCQHLKRNPATAHIPIMLMTAGGPSQAILKEAQVTDYLAKPFDIDTLLAAIARFLAKQTPLRGNG